MVQTFFNLNPVNFFIISGLVQNFILAGILFFRQTEKRFANRTLSATILIVNLHLTYLMLLDTNLDNLYPSLLSIPYSFLTALGPLIYIYTRAITDTSFKLTEVGLKHFVPLMLETGLQLVMIVQGIADKVLFYNTPLYFYVMPVIYSWTVISIFYYLNLAVAIINNHENWALSNYSNIKEITLFWLKRLIRYYRLLWIVWIPFVAVFLLFFRFQLMYVAVVLALYLFLLILTYLTSWIGIEGIGRTTLVFLKQPDQPAQNKNFSKLSDEDVQGYAKKINKLMTDEKLYLNEHLGLRELALQLEADPNLISYILNNHLKSTFYDFVNKYRVEEVKTRLNNPAYKHLTLLGIALESGFNSKTTFNRVFKQVTGITPTEFQKNRKRHV